MEAKSTQNQRILLGLLFAFCVLPIALFSQTTVPFTSTTTWTCPYGVTSVTVKCWGGGGSGGGEALNTQYGGGGGAGGAYAEKVVTVVPGTTYTVTVGATKTGTQAAGAEGNPTWFNTSGTVYARGGAGGAAPANTTVSGGAGTTTGSIGDIVYAGGNGADGTTTVGGGGGGGAGSTGGGGNASGTTAGTGTSTNGGNGGTGLTAENDGNAGSTYGGGGSGAFVADVTNHAGGSGAAGYLTLTYTGAAATLRIGASGDDFTSITAAADALEAAGVAAPIILEIQSDYAEASETYPITMTAISGTSATNTVIYRPATTVTGLVSDGSPASATALIKFDGADYIILDGRDGASGSALTDIEWTIRNTRTAATVGSVIEFINDASGNTLRYLNIEGESGSNGNVHFSTTTGSTGNDDNTISYCKIQDLTAGGTAGFPVIGISSTGTASKANSGNSVGNSHFIDIFGSTTGQGNRWNITLTTANDAWTITNNHFFHNSGTTLSTLAFVHGFVNVESGGGYTVTGNYMGGRAASCGGSAYTLSGTERFYPIYFNSAVSGTACTVNSNTIQNIAFTSTYAGIYFAGIRLAGAADFTCGDSDVGSSTGNTIGSMSTTGSITLTHNTGSGASGFAAIYCTASQTNEIDYNNLGGITEAGSLTSTFSYGIYINTTASTTTLAYNKIGGDGISNSINISVDNYFRAIHSSNTSGLDVQNCTIQQITHSATSNTFVGVSNDAGPLTCSNNTFSTISSSANATAIMIKHYNATTLTTVATASSNTISGITLSGTGASEFRAINLHTSGTITCNSNTIGSTTNNNISLAGAATQYGILFDGNGTITCNSNTIQEFDLTETSTSTSFKGIYNNDGAITTCNSNTIKNISSAGGATYQYGIMHGPTGGITDAATISSNTMSDISLTSSTSGFYCIYANSSGALTINSNTLGSTTNNNISSAGNTYCAGIRVLGTPSSLTINSNTIQEFNLTNTGTTTEFNGIYVSSGAMSATSNVITNIDNAGTLTGTIIRGIYCSSTSTGATINSNSITYLNATTAGASSPNVYGISITSGSSGGNLKKNFIADLTNTATSSPVIGGIYMLGGWSIHNNVILISNSSNTNNVTIRGLRDLSTGTVTVYHNTVKISGSASAGSLASYAYHREGAAPTSITVKNNIFQNLRTGGTGDHNAYYAQVVTGITTDYNYLQVSADAAKIGNWNGTNYTFADWKTAFTGEDNSYNGTNTINTTGGAPSDFTGANLGTDLFTGSVVTDDMEGTARDVNPWIGAYEGISYLKWTGVNNTDWNTGSNWFSGTKPTSSDEVILYTGYSNYPNIDEADAVCSALTIQNGATLTVSSGELTVGGKFDWDGAMTITGGTLDVNGEIELSSTMTETISAGTIECAGEWDGASDDGGFTPTGGTVVMDGGSSSNISNHANGTFYNLTIDRSGQVVTQTSSHTISGVLTITAGTLTGNGNNLTVASNWANSGTFTAGSGTVTFNGTSTISGSSTTSFNNVTITGTLTGASSANFNVAGNWVNSAGTFTHNSGTVTFNGSGAQTVTTGGVGATKRFNNVTINNTAGTPDDNTDVDADAIYVGGTLTVTDGQFQPATTSDFVAVTVSTNGILKADASAAITISGDYSNSGTFTHNNGTVTFDNAGAAQAIGGSSTSTFYNCIVDNGSTGVTLNRGINVDNVLTVTNGDIDLNSYTIALGTTGSISGETNSDRIKGTSGEITKTVDMSANSTAYTCGGIGLTITTQAAGNVPGSTTVARGHAAQSSGGNNSINRYFTITPTTNTSLGATLKFDFFANELNGQTANSDMKLYRSPSPYTAWSEIASTWNDAATDYVEATSQAQFSRWTVSNKVSSPLPVTLVDFTATAVEKSVEVKWSTSSEINNDYFTIERTQDGQSFEEVAVVEGAGNSNQLLNYVSYDNNPLAGTSYYRLKQTDFDGKFEYFNLVPVSFGQSSVFDFNISPNPIGTYQSIKIQLIGQGNETVNVRVNDMFGKEVFKNSVQMDRKEKTVNIASNDALSSGVYFIICEVNGAVSSKKLVVR